MKYILTEIPNYIINNDYSFSKLNDTERTWHPVRLMGGNAGNCMFWESSKRIIQNQTSCEILNFRTFSENIGKYIDNIESVVFTLANNICPIAYTQLDVYHNLIKDLNCKKYLFSIGAQNKTLDMRKFAKKEIETYNNFLPCFEYVYLRGQYTYDLLKYNDIPLDNAKVVGCPSILLKHFDTDSIKEKFKRLENIDDSEVKVGINFPLAPQHERLYKLFENLMSNTDVYTLAVNDCKWYDYINNNKKIGINILNKNRGNFKFSNNVFELMDYFADRTDFMIGTRIHGTVLGLSAGIPSICMVIDSRTYELCEQMNIPYINCINKPVDFGSKNELVKIFKNNFKTAKLDLLKNTLNTNKNLYKI